MKAVFFWLGALCVLIATAVEAQNVTRGPYLQLGRADTVTVQWRTDSSTDSFVRYGLDPAMLNQTASVVTNTTEHSVTLTGLTPDTRYYYSVGDNGGAIAGDSTYYFDTSPPDGVASDTRIWVLGDSGSANNAVRNVRDAYQSYTGARGTDLLLMLGDNAYNDGTDNEYQDAVFDIFPEVLRQTPLWPTLGNHDGHSADSATQTGPYYDIFTLPTGSEGGGLASGTEAYYSFNYGDIHFIVLESHETDRSVNGAMMTWLGNDLAANDKLWVIAFWHHPPYSKGSHDSDNESQLIEMRTNALPILEMHGADLVLSGHSHSYERSFLIDGHYGDSDSFNASHQVDDGDGRSDGDGVYDKMSGPNAGAVYTVAGSSSINSGGALNHEAMFISLASLGSMVIDINGNQLDATFLDSGGTVRDYFTITKGPDTLGPSLVEAIALSDTQVEASFNEELESVSAQTAANYSINGDVMASGATLQPDGRTVVLTTSSLLEGVVYTLTVNGVTDVLGNAIEANSQAQFINQDVVIADLQQGLLPDAGYVGMRDTYISEDKPNDNYGNITTLLVDGNDGGGDDLATLMAWDLAAIPADVTVTAASVTISVFDPTPSSYGLFGLLQPWVESEATWNEYAGGQAWQSAGADGAADRDATSIGALAASVTGLHTIALNSAGVDLVQSWIDGSAANNGFIIADTDNSDGADFRASEYGVATQRPRLSVEYAMPPDNDGDGIIDADDNCTLVVNVDQRDTNGDGIGNICDADFDQSGQVNFVDLSIIKDSFFAAGDLDTDLDGDGLTNFADLNLVKNMFFGAPGPAGVIVLP